MVDTKSPSDVKPKCSTCIHWRITDSGRNINIRNELLTPRDPDTYEPMVMPFEVRQCTNPALLFCERPVESNGFAVADGSEYVAGLFTAQDFGCVRCVRHEVAK